MKDQNRRIWPYCVPPPKSPMILDNFGVTISMESLKGWDIYKAARRELFGTNWLSRFWKGRIYPVVRPGRYLERKRRFEKEQSRMQQQFLAAVLERANEKARPETSQGQPS